MFTVYSLQSGVTKSTDHAKMTAVNHSAVPQDVPMTLTLLINLIVVRTVQMLRQQRRGRIETTNKLRLAD